METTTTTTTGAAGTAGSSGAGTSPTGDTAASKPGATAQDVASKAQDAAAQAASKAQDATQQVAEQASEQAHKVADEGLGRLHGEVDRRSSEFGERATGTAEDLRSISGHLRDQGNDQPAQLAEQIADRVERFGRYLRDTDSDALLRDVERVARRQPWTVIAGGVAAGFFASRLLKASSSERYRQQGSTSANTTPSNGSTAGSNPGTASSTGTRAGTPGAGKGAGTPLDDLATHAERIPGAQPPAGGPTSPSPGGIVSGGAGSRAGEPTISTTSPEGSVHGEHRA